MSETPTSPFIATLPRLSGESWERLNMALADLETCLKAAPDCERIDADAAYVGRLVAVLRVVGRVLIDVQLMDSVLVCESWRGETRFDTWAREFLHQAHPDLTAEQLAEWMQRPTLEGKRPGGDPVFFRHMADKVQDVCASLRDATNPDRPSAREGQGGGATATEEQPSPRLLTEKPGEPGGQLAYEGHLHEFLWTPAADPTITRGFEGKRHDELLRILRDKADAKLPGHQRTVILQCLGDAGCDLLIDWGGGFKFGIQLKSHYDIGEQDFAANTTRQIQDSRQHGLKKLYVLLAGDLTDNSQHDKVREFESRVSKMNDGYVVTVSPDRFWTLLFQ